MTWTDDTDKMLITLWNEGKGFKQIAALLGVTIGTVAGRKHRLEKMGTEFQKRVSPIWQRPKPKSGVDYLTNTYGCRAILDVRGSDGLPMVCGLPRGTDFAGRVSSYCKTHYAAYNYVSQARNRSYYG